MARRALPGPGPALAVLVALAVLGGCRQDGEPLPVLKVSGSTLESPALNFRVRGPEGWTWSEEHGLDNRAAEQHAFRARRDEGTFFTVVVARRNRFDLSEADVSSFALGILRATVDAGVHSSLLTSEPRSVPFGKSFRFSYTEGGRIGGQGYLLADGVLIAAGRLYGFLYVSPDRAHLAELNALVRSFELLGPPSRDQPPAGAPPTWGKATGSFLLTALLLAAGAWVALAILRASR